MFIVGRSVSNNNFFDRSKMKQQVYNFIQSKQDFMIKAPRRYGKTSLTKEVLGSEQYVYIDIRRISSMALIPNEIINSAYYIAGISQFIKKIKENVVGFLHNLKSDIKIDLRIVQASAQYLTQSKDTNNACQDLVFALNTVNAISSSISKPITIVFDEFQDIKKFKCEENSILEVLRGCLQHLEFVYCIFLDGIDVFKQLLIKLQRHPENTTVVMQNIYYKALEKKFDVISNINLNNAYENAYFDMMDLVEQYIIVIQDKKHYHDVENRYQYDNKNTHRISEVIMSII